MSSHINKFKNRFIIPPEKLQYHTSMNYVQYYPCSILKGRLYLGDANHATSKYVVRNMRITHIANITDVVPRAFEQEDATDSKQQKIQYLQIVVCDKDDVNIIDYFPDFYWFLEDAYNTNLHEHYEQMQDDVTICLQVHKVNFEKKTCNQQYKTQLHEKFDHIANRTVKRISHNKVLVHCQMGRSRSATLVIMYMLYKTLVDHCEIDCDSETMTKYV